MNLDDVIKGFESPLVNWQSEEMNEYNNQLAIWLKDYKRLLEKEATPKTLEERLEAFGGKING